MQHKTSMTKSETTPTINTICHFAVKEKKQYKKTMLLLLVGENTTIVGNASAMETKKKKKKTSASHLWHLLKIIECHKLYLLDRTDLFFSGGSASTSFEK